MGEAAAAAALKIAEALSEHAIENALNPSPIAADQQQLVTLLGNLQTQANQIQFLQAQGVNLEQILQSQNLITSWTREFKMFLTNNDAYGQSKMKLLLKGITNADTGADVVMANVCQVVLGERGLAIDASSQIALWEQQFYNKMYTSVNGTYSYGINDYLQDFDQALATAISMMHTVLIFQIVGLLGVQYWSDNKTEKTGTTSTTTAAAEASAEATTTTPASSSTTSSTSTPASSSSPSSSSPSPSALADAAQKKAEALANMNTVLKTAYSAFPPLIQKWKQNYQDPGSNLTNWFRFYWPNRPSHTKNSPQWLLDNPVFLTDDFWIKDASCEDPEGVYPEVEWRFDADAHPLLVGPCLIHSRDRDDEIQVGYDTQFNQPYWVTDTSLPSVGMLLQFDSWSPQYFHVLPKSVADMQDEGYSADEVGFIILPGSQDTTLLGTGVWSTDMNNVCYMRDKNTVQSSWVRTPDTGTYPPGQTWINADG